MLIEISQLRDFFLLLFYSLLHFLNVLWFDLKLFGNFPQLTIFLAYFLFQLIDSDIFLQFVKSLSLLGRERGTQVGQKFLAFAWGRLSLSHLLRYLVCLLNLILIEVLSADIFYVKVFKWSIWFSRIRSTWVTIRRSLKPLETMPRWTQAGLFIPCILVLATFLRNYHDLISIKLSLIIYIFS